MGHRCPRRLTGRRKDACAAVQHRRSVARRGRVAILRLFGSMARGLESKACPALRLSRNWRSQGAERRFRSFVELNDPAATTSPRTAGPSSRPGALSVARRSRFARSAEVFLVVLCVPKRQAALHTSVAHPGLLAGSSDSKLLIGCHGGRRRQRAPEHLFCLCGCS